MPPRAARSLDDLLENPALAASPLIVLLGDEELLVGRSIAAIGAAARRTDPSADVQERAAGDLVAGELYELLGPSLFGERRVVVVRGAQDVVAATTAVLVPLLATPADGVTLVLHHVGGAKGKALLEAARAAKAVEVACAKLTRPEERQGFVRSEVRRVGGTITADGVAALVDAVGSDLRELSSVATQLAVDAAGPVDADVVAAYHSGRAEVTGFAVSDRAVQGDLAGALTTLRWARSVGVPQVVVADAMADGIRTIARVVSAGRGDPYTLASALGMPPWKVKRAQSQARGWSETGLRAALGVVAQLNADVKGVAADADYALERAVGLLAQARRS